jgi:amino acid transporter
MMVCGTLSIATHGEFETTPFKVVAIYLVFLVVHGLMNTFAVKLIAILGTVSVWWHIVGVIAIAVAVLAFAPAYASPKWVFGDFENGTGWSSDTYAALLGLLMSQFTMTGYDASALMTEETKRADIAGPVGIVMAVVVSFFAGWTLLFGLTFGIQDYNTVVNSPTGVAIAQIFLDTVGAKGAILCMCIVMGAMFFAGMASVTASSRMMYILARDDVVPGSKVWSQIHPTYKTPVASVWASVTVAGIMGALYLVNSTAFTAITSLATITLNVSYGLPILCRLVNPSALVRGPVSLGAWSKPIGFVACGWITFTTVLFTLPTAYPITPTNMNYTSVGMVTIIFFILAYWLLSAKSWFKGPGSSPSEKEKLFL